eukprot:9471091-Pyramimonas_sp.AAC.2
MVRAQRPPSSPFKTLARRRMHPVPNAPLRLHVPNPTPNARPLAMPPHLRFQKYRPRRQPAPLPRLQHGPRAAHATLALTAV